MPLKFLKSVAGQPMPLQVSGETEVEFARQCAEAQYLEIAEIPATSTAPAGQEVKVEIRQVLPEGWRALEIFDDAEDRSTGFLDLY